jgi:hypothetical protein
MICIHLSNVTCINTINTEKTNVNCFYAYRHEQKKTQFYLSIHKASEILDNYDGQIMMDLAQNCMVSMRNSLEGRIIFRYSSRENI